MYATRVLVVDDDPWTQSLVSAVLRQAGLEVDLASDGWEGLLVSARLRPDMVVTSLDLPTTDGPAFLRTLRSRLPTSRVPAVILAPQPTTTDGLANPKLAALDPALDTVLAKPLRAGDLEAFVTSRMPRSTAEPLERPADSTPPLAVLEEWENIDSQIDLAANPGLSGQLEQFGLSSLLIVLELERKTGRLVVDGLPGQGSVELREGRVVRAWLAGVPPVRGAPAVYEMLAWSQGAFRFDACDVPGTDEVGSSTSYLLMEGARLADERRNESRPRSLEDTEPIATPRATRGAVQN
jgi:CheY-like chemotaxis protein